MLSFLCEETAITYTHKAFRKEVLELGVEISLFDAACKELVLQAGYPRVINIRKFLDLLSSMPSKDPASLAQMYHIFSWKLQGTDGVRGLVASPYLPVREALSLFLQKKILTSGFCYLYAKAFVKMLETQGSFSKKRILAFAEDGRDFFSHQGLKQAIFAALSHEGVTIHDLGILPTPFLAKYSLQKGISALMLTASHNPASYNGIKAFIEGKKLYPQGFLGEYCLSAYFLDVCEDTSSFKEPSGDMHVERILLEQESCLWLLNQIKPLSVKPFMKSPLLLDTADGAYSSIAKQLFTYLEIPFSAVACTPGNRKINANCGVGILEELKREVTYSKDLPPTLLSLFDAGRQAETKQAYCIVLDGDGDRAFVLIYQGESDHIHLYDGDDLGYLLAYSKTATYQGEKQPLFVSTIESDANLALSVAKHLKWQTKTTCIGDRWLVDNENQKDLPFIGCERSGHLIIPLEVEVEDTKKRTEKLCSGNGLLTALLALKVLVENKEPPAGFTHGYRACFSQKTEGLQNFHRNSPIWNTFFREIQRAFPWGCTEQQFSQEPDMIFFTFTSSDSTDIGHCYMRKSGTEPKISICVSVGKETEENAKHGLDRLRFLLETEFQI